MEQFAPRFFCFRGGEHELSRHSRGHQRGRQSRRRHHRADARTVRLETRLLRQARASGARAIDGLGMLLRQGAIAFEMWTGEGPVSEIAALMRAAL